MSNVDTINKNWELTIESPGRINIIGEHIDYNDGFVLPTAIDKRITMKFRKNGDSKICNITSFDFNSHTSFSLNKVKISKNNWENYILGVISEIQKLCNKLEGFDCEFSSTIPIGAGVSSSAALECGIAYGLNELFKLNLSKLDIVKLSQNAEHNYVGTKCGIMDQFASVMSKKEKVILLDCRSLEYNYIPVNIQPYTFLLVNTNVKHNLTTSEYNVRRQQCDEGIKIISRQFPAIKSFRQVSLSILNKVKSHMSQTIFNRCKFVVEETSRVLKSANALTNNNFEQLGLCMYQSHNGLKSQYQVSCDELDFLVDFTKNKDYVAGSRMMGGGFGGCTINFIKTDAIDTFVEEISEAYFNKYNIKPSAFVANPDNGTTAIKHTSFLI